ATGKNWAYFNVQEYGKDELIGLDFLKDVEEWNTMDEIQDVNAVFIPSARHNEVEVREAKVAELRNWNSFSVYEEVQFTGQKLMSTRWVITEKNVNGNHSVKARLVVRGFEEENEVKSDSPTIHKESMRLFLTISSTLKLSLHTIDVKAAFLQGNEVDREIYVKVPEECASDKSVVWKLKKCVYGLVDASRNWFLSVKTELLRLGCTQSKLDPALFYWHQDGQLQGLFLMHQDNSFKYIGLNITQEEGKIFLDQQEYTEELEQISGSACETTGSKIQQEVIGQLHWIATQTRPDLSFANPLLLLSFDVLDLQQQLEKAVPSS
ncbi:MAG: reverse transcriptase domain-containing protein, partial [Sedimenticola sp.]